MLRSSSSISLLRRCYRFPSSLAGNYMTCQLHRSYQSTTIILWRKIQQHYVACYHHGSVANNTHDLRIMHRRLVSYSTTGIICTRLTYKRHMQSHNTTTSQAAKYLYMRPIYTKTLIALSNTTLHSSRNNRISTINLNKQLYSNSILHTNGTTTTQHYCQPQYQQIRTILRRNKKKELEKRRRKRKLAKAKGFSSVFFQRHNERKYIPITLRTHIGRLLNRATRGNQSLLSSELQKFVVEYMTKYNIFHRKNTILPYIRENFQRIAYRDFFLRVLKDVPTIDVVCTNNTVTNKTTKINGMQFVIQFRTDLMEVIYEKANELKTLETKIKLNRLRLVQYEKLKKIIRQHLSQYILSLSLQPYRIVSPQQKLPLELQSSNSPLAIPDNDTESPTKNDSDETIIKDFHDKEASIDSDTKIIGHIRRIVKYSDLSDRVRRARERLDPMIQRKFELPNKYVYGWYQSDNIKTHPDPEVLTFVSLHDTIPKSLNEILNSGLDDGNVDNISNIDVPTIRPQQRQEIEIESKVACFYNITVLNPALQKIGLGEYMIRPIIQEMYNDSTIPSVSSIQQFATLLPLYSFRNWLLNNEFEDDISLLVINNTSDDFNTLQKEWDCPPEQVIRRLKAILCRNYESYLEVLQDKPIVTKAVDNLLLRSAAAYLVRAKTPVFQWRCNPLEISTRYHVAHGASIFRINLNANPTEAGWTESCGLMTNHVYDVQKLMSNQKKFLKKFQSISVHDQVKQYVPKTRRLQLTKEQRKKWIPDDPVRKKMIELSQNGKLFKVPLIGPPEFSRKRKFRQSLVPPRLRPELIPPVVPTVGVSGLTVYVKPPKPTSSVPSYVTRTIKGKNQAGKGRKKPTQITFWPDEVKIETIPPVEVEYKKRTTASQRGNRKQTKMTWDSVQ